MGFTDYFGKRRDHPVCFEVDVESTRETGGGREKAFACCWRIIATQYIEMNGIYFIDVLWLLR